MIFPDPAAIWRHRRKLGRWKHEVSHRQRKVLATGRWLELVEYRVKVPLHLKGMRLLFFSDLHWQDHPGLAREIENFARKAHADWVIFGGDLISFSCFLNSANAVLKTLEAKRGKLAVPGNWDRKRWKWFSQEKWRAALADAGFEFLCNQPCNDKDGLRFWGTDDLRLGQPVFEAAESKPDYQVVIAHNPDTAIELEDHLHHIDLILCGHTHAGQIRLPLIGPLYTSSVYWRKFDYGLFRNEKTGSQMIVTSGIGSSSLDIRMRCPREMLLIRFL